MKSNQELIEDAWKLITDAALVLSLTGNLPMTFIIEGPDNMAAVTTDAEEIINSPEAKDWMTEQVRHKVKELNAHTVFMLSDSWMAKLSDPALAELVHTIGTAEAERRGLIKRREAVTCQICTRTEQAICSLFYKRDDAERKITLEEREEMPFSPLSMGRLSDYFAELNPPTKH